MIRRRPRKVARRSDWKVTEEFRVNGRLLTKGVECKIRDEPGRFIFQRAVENAQGAVWLDFIGGPKGFRVYRAFVPERVRTVHRLRKTESALVEQRKEAAA